MGRRDFVALTSAAALAGGAMFTGATAQHGMNPAGDRRPGGNKAPGANAARRWAALRPLPTDDAFLGSSPMLGGASPLGILPRNVRGRQRAATGPSQPSARNG